MAQPNRARSIDWLRTGVRKADGSVNANGVVKAFVGKGATPDFSAQNPRVPKKLWRFRDQSLRWYGSDENEVPLDGNGFPQLQVTDDGDGVFGVGDYLLEVRDSSDVLQYELEDADYDTGVANAVLFGAVGDGMKDDYAALQAAIDHCLQNTDTRLYIPPGTYRITKSLLIAWPRDGSPYTVVGIEIFGAKRGALELAANDRDTIIYADIGKPDEDPEDPKIPVGDQPAIIIQGARGVVLRNLTIRGRNDFGSLVDDAGSLINDSVFNAYGQVTGTPPIRDSTYSPYAGIAIDPFFSYDPLYPQLPAGWTDGMPPDGGYPRWNGEGENGTFPNLYVGTQRTQSGALQGALSSGITIAECAIENFIVGIVVSPAPDALGSEISITGCTISTNRVAIATGQTQNKAITVTRTNTATQQFMVSTRDFGRGVGAPPALVECSVGITKYAFNLYLGFPVTVDSLFLESTLSLGYVGATSSTGNENAVFKNCTLTFWDTVATTGVKAPAIDMHLWSSGNVRFLGCVLGTNKGIQPLTFFSRDQLTFEGCYIGVAANNGTPQLGFHDFNVVNIEQLATLDGSGLPAIPSLRYTSPLTRVSTLADANRLIFTEGATLVTEDDGAVRMATQQLKVISLGDVPMSRSATNPGRATFEMSSVSFLQGHIKVGDLLYCDDGWTPQHYPAATQTTKNKGVCGLITDIEVTGTVTVDYVPLSLDLGDPAEPTPIELSVKYLARLHEPTTGDISYNNLTILNVTPDPTVDKRWVVGDRIYGANIPVGARVANVTSSQIVISLAPTGSATGAALYEAQLREVAMADRPNVFSARQTFDGGADQTVAALVSHAPAATRKLLWELAGASGEKTTRLYHTSAGPEITINARWSASSLWFKDVTDDAAKYEFRTGRFRLFMEGTGASSFADTAWSGQLDFVPDKVENIFFSDGEFTAPGQTEAFCGTRSYGDQTQYDIGSGCTFRKVFPSSPSSVTFPPPVSSFNLSGSLYATAVTNVGTGVASDTSSTYRFSYFYARVYAS